MDSIPSEGVSLAPLVFFLERPGPLLFCYLAIQVAAFLTLRGKFRWLSLLPALLLGTLFLAVMCWEGVGVAWLLFVSLQVFGLASCAVAAVWCIGLARSEARKWVAWLPAPLGLATLLVFPFLVFVGRARSEYQELVSNCLLGLYILAVLVASQLIVTSRRRASRPAEEGRTIAAPPTGSGTAPRSLFVTGLAVGLILYPCYSAIRILLGRLLLARMFEGAVFSLGPWWDLHAFVQGALLVLEPVAAIGLLRRADWGRRMCIGVLFIHMVVVLVGVAVSGSAVLGFPIAGEAGLRPHHFSDLPTLVIGLPRPLFDLGIAYGIWWIVLRLISPEVRAEFDAAPAGEEGG